MEVNETPIFFILLLRSWAIRWSFLLLLQLWLMQRNIFSPKLAKREKIAEIRATFFINSFMNPSLQLPRTLSWSEEGDPRTKTHSKCAFVWKGKDEKRGLLGVIGDGGLYPSTPPFFLLHLPLLSNRWNSPRDPPRKREREREREERVGRCGQEMRLFFHWERIATKWPPSFTFSAAPFTVGQFSHTHTQRALLSTLSWVLFAMIPFSRELWSEWMCSRSVIFLSTWKLAEKRDSFYKHIAGGPKPLFSGNPKMPGKVSKSRMQRLDHFILQQGALKLQGCGKCLESSYGYYHGEQMMYMCVLVRLNICSHMSTY